MPMCSSEMGNGRLSVFLGAIFGAVLVFLNNLLFLLGYCSPDFDTNVSHVDFSEFIFDRFVRMISVLHLWRFFNISIGDTDITKKLHYEYFQVFHHHLYFSTGFCQKSQWCKLHCFFIGKFCCFDFYVLMFIVEEY